MYTSAHTFPVDKLFSSISTTFTIYLLSDNVNSSSSAEPIFNLLEQAWYSTHTDFIRQTRTVHQMNQLLLCIYSIVFSRVESGVCILNIDGALQYPPILADLVNIMDINISKMTPII